VKAALDWAGYKLILACLHPDNSASEQKRNKAFVLFQGLQKAIEKEPHGFQ
jgi:hypothetical protein